MTRRLPHFVLCIAASAMTTGCALGPRPSVSTPPLPASWNGQSGNSETWPDADWWHAFGSPELDSLIALAQAQNSDIAGAEARMEQADAQARIAGAALLPTVGVQPIASTIRSVSPSGNNRRYSPLGGVVSASYELDLWGKLHDAHVAAKDDAQAASFDVAVVRLSVTTAVVTTYIRLLAMQDQIADAKADAEGAALILAGYEVQQQHGLVTGLQVAEQRNVASQLSAAVPALEVQRTHLVDALAILTGRTPEDASIKGGSLDALTIPTVSAGLPSDLLFHRPDIQAAEQALAAADANISVARKSFLPTISLTGSGGAESVALASAVTGPTSIFNIGLSMLQPIFSGGRLRGNLDQANGRYRELAAEYIKSIHQAYGDTEDALATISGGTDELAGRGDALAAAKQALDMARKGVSAGTTDTLTLLSAQQALSRAHGIYSQAQLNRMLGVVALYKALGGGWSVPQSRQISTATPGR